MRIKKIVIPTLTVIMIASMLQGCAATSQDETLGMLNNSSYIELTVTEPESVQQGEKEKLEWIEVGSLTDVEDLRNGWDEAFETSGTTGNKSGTPTMTRGEVVYMLMKTCSINGIEKGKWDIGVSHF